MRSGGEFVECDFPLREMPSRVAALLKYKKHEWIVIAFIRTLHVRRLWWNKGPDRTQVRSLLKDDLLKGVIRSLGSDAIAVLHNHPNPDPSHYRTSAPSEVDLRSADLWREWLAKVDVAHLEFVCERGVPYLYYASFTDSVLPLAPIVDEIVAMNGGSIFRNYALRRELRRTTKAERLAGDDLRTGSRQEKPTQDDPSPTACEGLPPRDRSEQEKPIQEDASPAAGTDVKDSGGGVFPVEGDQDSRHLERAFRPQRLSDYLGQKRIVELLDVSIQAARSRDEPLEHVLLLGSPGLGKRTLAHIIAREMGTTFRSSSGHVLDAAGDLAAILTNLEPGDVLFIDEIHRLGPTVAEILYTALEDFQLDLVIGSGPMARTVRIDLPHFTLVGATTRAGLVTSSLQACFGIVHRLPFYDPGVLNVIIQRAAEVLELPLDQGGADEIAQRSRGIPRIANRLLRRVRDIAQIEGDGRVDRATAKRALAQLEVDEYGLDKLDRKLMRLLIEQYGGGPAGLKALAASVDEDQGTVENIYAPYLIQKGFLQHTGRGVVATRRAFAHLACPSRACRSRLRPK